MSTEPARPRPRPRPRPQAKASSPPGPSSEACVTPSSPGASSRAAIDAEDALFIRKPRTAKQWKELKEREQKNKPPVTINISDDEASPPRSKTQKRSKTADRVNPAWANKNVKLLLLSDEDSDNSDNSIETTPVANGKRPAGKRKRARSKSRSITPPPELSMYHIEQARNLVRQALDSAPRAASPTYRADDSLDNITLDPELALIAKAIRNAPKATTSGSNVVSQGGGPERVTVKVKWRPHPLDDSAKVTTSETELKRHSSFRDLFASTADEAGVLEKNMVVSYEGKRVFASTTPHGIGIWAEAELEACAKATYEYIRTHKHERSPSPTNFASNGKGHAPREGTQDLSDADASESEETQKFKLTVRSSMTTKDISLTVRPTTTCGAIVKGFLKAAGLLDQYPSVNGTGATPRKGKNAAKDPRLSVEGEKMDPSSPISQADVEDGDCVDVVGL
ncbi:hypothetical protein FIBSPDRAFT_863245 [Athelia psychrophila]|uniref:Rad60/SUMO-like domain-containing protein n=1 Tax=Athelia psychrophila TaxID=1759441 RepID=A0A166HIG5_9AGAM|nr:hypothetical protein FIBSPDRAFT_863245 [Fibularhizoctonia sp. CBS 109695]